MILKPGKFTWPPRGGRYVRDLVGCWLFNEGSGNKVFDLSGNEYAGSISGCLWEPGKSGASLYFDGIDDYIDVGDLDLTAPLTIVFSGKVRALGINEQTWFSKRNGTTCNLSIGIDVSGLSSYSRFFYYSSGWQIFRTTSQPLTINKWHQQAWVYDGASNPTLYVDGKPISTTYDTGSGYPALVANSVNSYIGNQVSPTDEDLQGSLEYMYIYNRALSASEIAQLYRMFLIGTPLIFEEAE